MFASVRNAFQRNLVISNDGSVNVSIGKQLKTEPILDKAFIVSGLNIHFI